MLLLVENPLKNRLSHYPRKHRTEVSSKFPFQKVFGLNFSTKRKVVEKSTKVKMISSQKSGKIQALPCSPGQNFNWPGGL